MSQQFTNNYTRPDQPIQQPYPPQQWNNYPPQGYTQVQQPGYAPQHSGYGYGQQPVYPAQVAYAGAYPAQKVKVPGNWTLYFIPLIGVILLAVGVFLPWRTYTISGDIYKFRGMDNTDGTIILSLAFVTLALVFSGLLTRSRGVAYAVIVFGVLSAGLMAIEVYLVVKNSSTYVGDYAEPGTFVGLTGGIIILIGGIITVAFFRRKTV